MKKELLTRLEEKYINKGINQSSPVQKDLVRKVKVDEKGNEYPVWEEVDYKKFQQSLGTISDWNLNNLLKAGVNPDFPIHTGFNTRLEGVGVIEGITSELDAMFAEFDKDNENNEF